MNGSRTHFALRQLRAHMGQANTLAVLAAVTAILALIGPFGPDRLIPLPAGLVHWGWVVTAPHALGYLGNDSVSGSLAARFGTTTLVVGAGVSLIVEATNRVVFGFVPSGQAMLAFLATTLAIAGIVNGAFPALEHGGEREDTAAAPPCWNGCFWQSAGRGCRRRNNMCGFAPCAERRWC